MNKRRTLLAWALVLIVAAGAVAQKKESETPESKPALNIGDAAPPLSTGKWIKGDPVKAFDKDKVYVVEFWATWCGPCRQSIPHLSKLQEEFKDKGVIVIGQDVSEEEQDQVAPFVEKMGDKMNYRVALDDVSHDKDGAMNTNWLTAAGQSGIPTSFVIDKQGKIAWIGHPMLLEEVLPAVVAGTFDAKKFAEEMEAKKKREEELAKNIMAANYFVKYGKPDEAARIVDKLPADNSDVKLLKYRILGAKGDARGAKELGQQLSKEFQDEGAALSATIESILASKEETKDLELAQQLATRINELTHEEDAGAWDLLARVYLQRNMLDEAILAAAKVEKITDDKSMKQIAQLYKIRALLRNKDKAGADAAADQVLAAAKDDTDQLAAATEALLAEKVAQNEALAVADTFLTHAIESAKEDGTKENLQVLKLRLALRKKDQAAAKEIEEQLIKKSHSDINRLATFVSLLAADEAATDEEKDLALKLVNRENELLKEEDPLVLSLLSTIYRMKGDLAKAIEIQTKAVKQSTSPEVRDGMQEELNQLKWISDAPSAPKKE